MTTLAMISALSVRNVASKQATSLFLKTQRILHAKMGDWKTEKEKYLKMSPEDKRKVYFKQRYYAVNDIPTWKEYVMIRKKLPEPIPALPSNTIEPSLNSKLADKISFFTGDISTLEIDVIVNAANKGLRGGAGVDGAIHRAAGWDLLQSECQTLNGCPEGEAKLTGGYKLPAKYVIHTAGPQGEKPGLLQLCYRNSMRLMLSHKFRTIAFPCISTGVYGYPPHSAAHVAVMEVRKQLEKHHNEIDRVIFCLFGELDEQIYIGILQSYFP
ncbi:hypothetical protein AMK59_5572, partial [Oryctes borbonicus]